MHVYESASSSVRRVKLGQVTHEHRWYRRSDPSAILSSLLELHLIMDSFTFL